MSRLEEAGTAWDSAGRAADELAAMLLAAPADPPPRTSIIKGMMSTASVATAKVIAATRGLLPVYRCRECGTIPDRWVVAKLLVGRLTSPEKPSDPED